MKTTDLETDLSGDKIIERTTIRQVTTEDLQRYHELCIAENWGIGFDRIQRMVETCPTGFWCADIDSKGVVSFCGCYDIGDNTAVVTSYVTDKQYRGKGIGREVFSKAISHYQGYKIYLNSVKDKVQMYGRSGFTIPIYSTLELMAMPVAKTHQPPINPNILVSEFNSLSNEIDVFDNEISPIKRNITWFIKTAHISLVAKTKEGNVKGFLSIRRVHDGLSFQPFYADDIETAEQLFINAMAKTRDEKVHFFIPTDNVRGLSLIKKYYKITESLPGNMWLGNKSNFSVNTQHIYSVLDYCFSVC